jgi:hypothetical protein
MGSAKPPNVNLKRDWGDELAAPPELNPAAIRVMAEDALARWPREQAALHASRCFRRTPMDAILFCIKIQ